MLKYFSILTNTFQLRHSINIGEKMEHKIYLHTKCYKKAIPNIIDNMYLTPVGAH